jgi:hypothetical protein
MPLKTRNAQTSTAGSPPSTIVGLRRTHRSTAARGRWLLSVATLGATTFAVSAVAAAPVAEAGSAVVANATSGFGVSASSFEVGTCSPDENLELSEELNACTYSAIEEQLAHHEPTTSYAAADGHPQYGVVTFEFNSELTETPAGYPPQRTKHDYPIGQAKNIRIDLPSGLSVNPRAVPQCPQVVFETERDECAASVVGTIEVTAVGVDEQRVLSFPIYNLVAPDGLPLETAFNAPTGPAYIEGGISWHDEPTEDVPSGDFHPYFELHNLSPLISILRVRQSFNGNALGSGFIRMPSQCGGDVVSHIRAESYSSDEDEELDALTEKMDTEVSEVSTHPPGSVEACDAPPFSPKVSVVATPATSDSGDAAAVVVALPQNTLATELDSSDLKAATIVLPAGMSLNPAAATGLTGCEPAQAGFAEDGTRTAITEIACPSGSKLGTVALETPLLAPGSLTGGIYLGTPTPAQLLDHEYTIYVDAENVAQDGVAVRLRGTVRTNADGRLETSFTENPQLPFTSLKLSFRGGSNAPLANPVLCGTAQANSVLTPFSGESAVLQESPLTVEGCATDQFDAPALSSTASVMPEAARAESTLTFAVHRSEGQRYIQQLQTTLPAGISAKLGSVPLCAEAQANAGTCSEASLIGSVRITAGSGEPFAFSGRVYLTGAYDGAAFGLSIVVPTRAGPFYFGEAVTRAKLEINPLTAEVTVAVVNTTVQGQTSSGLPTSVGGIPLRIREVAITINRPGFIINPTHCAALSAETSLTSVAPEAHVGLGALLAVSACNKLAFSPSLSASSNAATSRAGGASLTIKISQPRDQANIAAVTTTLPLKMPSRASTLAAACPRATFAANPLACPETSRVGSVTAVTPTLSGKLTGPAYLVSHGGSFPDLELVLEGSGVRLILDGQTNIRRGVTTASFGANPDVPLTSLTLSLPMGPHSLLSANGSLCAKPLHLPTIISGQNGALIERDTRIAVADCVHASGRVTGAHRATITAHTPTVGALRVSGHHLVAVTTTVGRSKAATIKVTLNRAGRRALRRRRAHGHSLRVRVRVRFAPSGPHAGVRSEALVSLVFG